MLLLTLQRHTTSLTSGLMLNEMLPRINALQNSVRKLTSQERLISGSVDNVPPSLPLLQSQAKRVISSAITIAEARSSRSGTSERSAGSEMGDPLEPAAINRITTWVSNTPTLVRESQISPDLLPQRQQISPSPFSDRPHEELETFLEDEEEDNDDDDLVSNFVDKYLREAIQHRDKKELADAEDCYIRALKKAELLSERKQHKLNLHQIKLDLGVTAFEMSHYDKAEVYLKDLADECSVRRISSSKAVQADNSRLRQGLTACYTLSKIYVQRNELAIAEFYCMKSLQGFYRLRAVDLTGYYPSARLLASIARDKGDDKEAKMFLDMIPNLPPPNNNLPPLPKSSIPKSSNSVTSVPSVDLPSPKSIRLSDPAESSPEPRPRIPRSSTWSRKGDRSSNGTDIPTMIMDEDPAVVQALEDNGFNVQSKSFDPDNALLWAARNGEEQVMRQLINGMNGRTAIGPDKKTKERVTKVKSLDKSDDEGHTPLIAASIRGHKGAAEILLFSGAKTDSRTKSERRTALHFAALRGSSQIVQVLVDAGTDLDATDAAGQTALHVVGGKDPSRIISILVEAGASTEAKTLAGCTPLHLAVLEGRQDLVECFLQHGAKINAAIAPFKGAPSSVSAASSDTLRTVRIPPLQQPTSLHLAATNGNTNILSVLLQPEYAAKIESRTTDGRTPLHAAVLASQLPAIQMLLERGADIESRDVHGRTALHLVVGSGVNSTKSQVESPYTSRSSSTPAHILILAHLLENNASTSSRESDGCTALHIAAFEGDVQAVVVLLDHGADPDLKRIGGHTAADLAKRVGQTEVVRVFEERYGKKAKDSVIQFKKFGLGMGRKLTA